MSIKLSIHSKIWTEKKLKPEKKTKQKKVKYIYLSEKALHCNLSERTTSQSGLTWEVYPEEG